MGHRGDPFASCTQGPAQKVSWCSQSFQGATINSWEPFLDIDTYKRQMLAEADRDLVDRAKARDRGAFDDLVGPVIDQAFRLAFGMLRDRWLAEDAVQEATVRAWRKLGNLRPGAPLRPWFLAIVANQCRTAMRARWWSVIRVDRMEGSVGPGFEDRIVRGADLRAALGKLATDQREVLVLRYYLDLPLEEVAAITGVPLGTVKSRINRGLAALRPHFDAGEALT
jgi:RNA polymerase sigma-70 factor (ECF subfamily)